MRLDRLQGLAREVLAEAIQGLKDPRIGFTTVTRVRITPDLRRARVLVSAMGTDQEREATMKGLQSALPVLRSELGRQMRMKYLPELILELDRGAEDAQRLEELFRRIHEQEENRGAPERG